ncbi:hypothetical protein An07g09100 [Aspergillus niger]|uniref:Uncharacterized protein n=2 Tax=Aspergillus niger TaxID=5061 RepID=A2QPD8_ASPNC|nr:hypothetical protein An07g09100 [Aspergillus niger]CAK45118.1 hypothetical protein An07g09100 [Aspergillus niger]
MIKFTSKHSYQPHTFISQNDPLSQLPYELLCLIIDYTADWITSHEDQHEHHQKPTPKPSASSKLSSKTYPIMSLQLRRHFRIITKLRQFSSQPAEETIPPPPHIYYQPTPPYELHDVGPSSWFEEYRVYHDDDVAVLMWIDVAEGEIRTDLELLEGLVGIWGFVEGWIVYNSTREGGGGEGMALDMLVRLKEDTPRTLCSSVTARKVTPD